MRNLSLTLPAPLLQPIYSKSKTANSCNSISPPKTNPVLELSPYVSKPNKIAVSTQKLKHLIRSSSLIEAKDLYVHMKGDGSDPGVVIESMLIDGLMKSGQLSDAFDVFGKMTEKNVVTWTSMIFGCAQNGLQSLAFSLFVEMLERVVCPNDFTFNAIIKACGDVAALKFGEQVHSFVIRIGFTKDSRIANSIIDFYARCGLMDKAIGVFAGMEELDTVTFTSLISGFCRLNMMDSAVQYFHKMVIEGFVPNEYTIASVLPACNQDLGDQIYAYMIKTDISESVYAACSLIELYARNNEIEQAKKVFYRMGSKNIVIWTSMISCCLRNEQVEDALAIFIEMVSVGFEPNEYTFATVIGASGLQSKLLSLGQQLHCSILKRDMISDHHILNSLLTMYARNGTTEELEKLFSKVKCPDIVSWCAIISGYFQNGFDEKAMNMISEMHNSGYMPNQYGFSSALSSCANLALSDQGRQLHCLSLKLGCDLDACVGNALINLYSKCGFLDEAKLAFELMRTHDLMSWNSLIHGYAHHGKGKEAMAVFKQMVLNKISPDHSTFLGILFACGHTGSVDQAIKYFKHMVDFYGIEPCDSHFACIIDMLGRAGRLTEAFQIIDNMSFDPDILTWKTLLGSCRLHNNLELGKLAAEKVTELSPDDSASYVLLSNLHSIHGEWEEAKRIRVLMEERGVKKDAGWSSIEVMNEMHSFVASDRSHPKCDTIYLVLDVLLNAMRNHEEYPHICLSEL